MISSSSAPRARAALGPGCKALVQLGPVSLCHRVVCRIPDQDVAEAEGVLPGERARVRLDQPLPDERLQTAGHLAHLVRRRQVGHRSPPEHLPDHRRALEHRTLVLVEPVEAGREDRLDRLRHTQRVDRGERLEPAVALDEHAVLDEHPQHLLEEERIASRGTPDRVGRLGIKRAGEVLQQRAGVLARKRRELDRRPRPRRPQLGQIRSRQAADEDRRVAAPAGQVLDEVEEGGLGPLDVVEHDDEGTLLRERLEQPAHGPVELVGARAWLGAADGLEDAPVRDLPVGLARERAVEVDVAHDLDEGPVGDPVPVRETAALEHLRFSGGRDQLGRKPGLADAGLADDRDDPASTVYDRALELGPERVQLLGPADER